MASSNSPARLFRSTNSRRPTLALTVLENLFTEEPTLELRGMSMLKPSVDNCLVSFDRLSFWRILLSPISTAFVLVSLKIFQYSSFRLYISIISPLDVIHIPCFNSHHYSDGTQEEWWETVERVVNGTFTIQKDWMSKHSLGSLLSFSGGYPYSTTIMLNQSCYSRFCPLLPLLILEFDENAAQTEAEDMYERIFTMKFLPPGRGQIHIFHHHFFV